MRQEREKEEYIEETTDKELRERSDRNNAFLPDINLSPQVREQFVQMGVQPEKMWTQIVRDPELADTFRNNPKVRAAMMECSQNITNITKYQDDPEVMEPIEKVLQLFPQAQRFLREYLIIDLHGPLYGPLMIHHYRLQLVYEKICVYIWRGSLCLIATAFSIALVQMLI